MNRSICAVLVLVCGCEQSVAPSPKRSPVAEVEEVESAPASEETTGDEMGLEPITDAEIEELDGGWSDTPPEDE